MSHFFICPLYHEQQIFLYQVLALVCKLIQSAFIRSLNFSSLRSLYGSRSRMASGRLNEIPVQLVDLEKGLITSVGKCSLPDVQTLGENTVGDVIERLSVSYPGSEIVVRNQLLELREDQRLAEVTDEGDTLTAFKQQRRSGAGSNMEEDDDLFVVILSSVTGELVFLRPGEASQLNLQKVAWNQIVSVFRSVEEKANTI